MKEIGAFEAKSKLGQLLDWVEAGEEVLITRRGKAVARLVPPEHAFALDRAAAARIRSMRQRLVERVQAKLPGADFAFVLRQRGMFSYSGLSKAAVTTLREKFSIYAIDTGRVCVAALNSRNLDYVADAIASVLH